MSNPVRPTGRSATTGTNSPESTVETLAEQYSARQLEDFARVAETAGDISKADDLRRAFMLREQPDLYDLYGYLDDQMSRLDETPVWRTWYDEGIIAWGIEIPVGQELMAYWIREGDLGFELLTDHVPGRAGQPTAFARRTVRVFPHSELGARQLAHLITAQVIFGRNAV